MIAGLVTGVVAWFAVSLLTKGRSPEIIRFTQLFLLFLILHLLNFLVPADVKNIHYVCRQ